MQAKMKRDDATSILHTVLQKIGQDVQPSQAVTVVMKALQDITYALGGSLTIASDSHTHLVVGDMDSWLSDVEVISDWMKDVPSQITYHHPLPNDVTVIANTWITAKLSDGALICLWFGASPSDFDDALLTSLLHLLEITHSRYQFHRQQQKAVLLSDSIINSILDPLLILDEKRRIIVMNKAAENLFQMESHVASGTYLADVVQDDHLMEIVNTPAHKVDRIRPPEWTTGVEGEYTFLPLLSVIHTPDGLPDGWVLSLRDVSRFKRLNRNQREFMRLVSHDLRSPLTSMQGFADMIRMGLVGEVTEKQIYFIDKVLSGVSQMSSIVDNIQDAGRFDPETGFYEMSRSHVDLGEIATEIVKSQIVPAEKESLKIDVHIADDVPIINADENMLKRAITNLVDNAVKYTPDGGRVDVIVERQDENVVISIKDDGYGISEENQKRLFQRHVRIARREHSKVKGTGLGLFIVKSVAHAHYGDAQVHSIEGEGTTFSLILPLSGDNLVGNSENT